MTFAELWSELKVFVPDLPVVLAQRLINRSLSLIYSHRPWTFLIAEANIVSPASITAGTMNVTRGSATVTPDATALAALGGLTSPLITRRQIKFSDGDAIYNIAAFDGSTITLDGLFLGTTNAASNYTIFQCYYSPPSTDFLRWISVTDLINGNELGMLKTKEEMDRIDPQRTSTGDPLVIAAHRAVPEGFWDANVNVGDPLYEFWPHPTSYRMYRAIYQRRGLELSSATDRPPSSIPDELVLAKAKKLAYDWKLGIEPEFLVAYRSLVPSLAQEYTERLRQAMVQDDELFNTQWLPRLGARGWDSNWAQAHAVPGGEYL